MNKQVRITRAKHSKENPYFQMLRTTAQDERLSFEARGLLAYLLSKSDNWEVRVYDLTQQCGESRVYRILKELRTHGYMTFKRTRNAEGIYNGGVYEVYEEPCGENPDVDNPDVDNPRVENRDDIENTDCVDITDLQKVQTAATPAPVEPVKVAAAAAAVSTPALKVLPPPETPKFSIITLYQNSYGFLVSSPMLKDELLDLEKTYPQDWLEDAFKKAALAHAKHLGYVTSILEDWSRNGKNAPKAKVVNFSGAPLKDEKPDFAPDIVVPDAPLIPMSQIRGKTQ